jgi:PAS domain S-box-containing protein
MHPLASTIRNRMDTLAEEYDRRLRGVEGYAELPDQVRFDAARYDLNLIATCLEACDDAEFIQFIRTRAGERIEQGFGLEPLLQVLTALEETLQPLVTTVVVTTFLWRALSQARTIVSRRTAEMLRESELKFRQIVDRSPVGIFRTTPEGRIVEANPAFLRIVGYDSLEAINQVGVPSLYQDSADREHLLALLRQGPVPDFETRFQRADGEIITVSINVRLIYDEEGSPQFLEGIIEDITERKRAEEALFGLERAVEQSIDGIAVADMEGNIQFVNPAWAQMHSYNTEELPGKHLSIFHTEEQLQEDVAPFNEQVMKVGAHQGEVGHVRRDGTTFPTWMSTTLLKDEKGNPVGLVGTARDITERKRLEQAIQESLERRGRQVQTSTEVAQEIAAAPALDELFHRVVTLIKERFGYYHAQIFRYEPAVNAVVLVIGYGEAGEKMLAEGHRLEMGRGVVGMAAATGQPVLATDVTQDADWVPNPHLPETKGELAMPIILRRAQDGELREQVLGILDVQSDRTSALTEDDQVLLEGLCGQIAIAVESTRLRQETEENLRELERLYRAMSREGWETFQRKVGPTGYLFDRTDVIPADDFWMPEIGLAMERQALMPPMSDDQPVAVTPLSVRGKIIGALGVQDDPRHPLSQDDLALVESVSEQVALALESARLFGQTQAALAQTEALYTGSEQLVRAMTVDDVLQILIHSTALQRLDRVNFLFFDHPLLPDDQPDAFTVAAVWERSGEEPSPPVGTRYDLDQFPAGQVVSGQELTIVRDVAVDKRLDEDTRDLFLNQLGMQSIVFWPLVVGGQWFGLLTGQARTVLDMDEDEIRWITSLTDQAAILIQNMRLFEQTQAALAQTEALYAGSDRIVRATTLDNVLQALIHSTTLQRLDRVSLVFFNRPWEDEMPEEATVVAAWERSGEESLSPVGTRYPLTQFPVIEAVTRSDPAIFRDITTDERVYETLRTLLLNRLGMRSLVLWPLVAGGQWIGFLNGQAATALEIDSDEIRWISSLTDQAATVIQNMRLFEGTQARAERERTIREISDQMQRATDMETLMRITAEELNRALGGSRTYVRLGTEVELGSISSGSTTKE